MDKNQTGDLKLMNMTSLERIINTSLQEKTVSDSGSFSFTMLKMEVSVVDWTATISQIILVSSLTADKKINAFIYQHSRAFCFCDKNYDYDYA